MGSGSRIDHQHHLVATTAAGSTITAPSEDVVLGTTPEQQQLVDAVLLEARRLAPELAAQPATWPIPDDVEEWSRQRLHLINEGVPIGPLDAAIHDAVQESQRLRDAFGGASYSPESGFVPSQRGDSLAGITPDDRAVQRAAAQQVLDEVAAEHQAATALQEQAREQWPADRPVNYTDDFDAFQRDFEAARDRAERGEQVIPYMTENATGGLGAREGGRGFGVEIEFDIQPGVDRRTALRNIGREMHEAGLARDSRQHGYHAQQQAGYTDAPNAWRLEDDCTVAGEIVSPILYDEPQTWNNLAQVCEIVERNGGRASFGTGGHVHVGMHDYDHDVANHTRLMQTYAQHEDVLYRLAQNPSSEGNRHRGTRWCRPNPVPSQGYTALSQVQSYHGMAVNLSGAMRGGQSAHGEFRLWDGSLSPSVIQTQVKLSLGMAAAAVRQDSTPTGSRMALGSHREQRSQAGVGQRRRLSGDDWRTNTADFRQMVDSLFQRPEDKAQATSLFQQTRWQGR